MIGGLLGALVAPKLQGRFSLAQLVILLTGPGTLFVALAAVLIPSPLVALPLAIPLMFSPTANAALFAAMIRRTPEGMQGRVNNALLQAATGLAAFAPVTAGLLVAHTSAHWAMGVFAAALGISGVVALCLKGIREAEKLASAGPVKSVEAPAQVTST